jgi:5-methylcytosine-specific restriction endonuclease McrA
MDRRRGPFRQRGYGREWEAVRAQVLAEESVCHICGREVDKRLSGDDPLGPTVDHVRRLADSGTNERANLRLAHRRCNSSRHGGRAHGAPQPEPAQRYRHGSTGLR